MATELQTERIVEKLFGPVASKRHAAVDALWALPDKLAIELLEKAITHWDKRLVKLCAADLVRRIGRSATDFLLSANGAGTLSTVATLELLKGCDCPEAFLFVRARRDAGRKDWRDKANETIQRFTCPPAVLYRWESAGAITPELREQLDTVSDEAVRAYLKSLDLETLVILLNSRSTRIYLAERGISAAFEHVEGPDGAFLRLVINPRIGETDYNVLSAMPREDFRKQIKTLHSWSLLPLWEKRPFRDLVMHHELVAEFPELLELHKLQRKEEWAKEATKLAERLVIEKRYLGRLCRDWNYIEIRYKETEVPKKSGGTRVILAPDFMLKMVQRAIYKSVLANQKLHAACHGFRKQRSTATNAAPHRNQEVVINLDLQDFFPSISGGRVYGLFRELGFNGHQARLLTRLTTYENALPQGAPTSPAIANLITRRLDSRLAGLAKVANVRYTRYADDLTFSGGASAVSLLTSIRWIISEEGFRVAAQKTHISRRNARQNVTGLTVNDAVSVPRLFRRRLRAVLHRIENGLSATWNGRDVTASTLSGLAAYVRPFHPDLARQCADASVSL